MGGSSGLSLSVHGLIALDYKFVYSGTNTLGRRLCEPLEQKKRFHRHENRPRVLGALPLGHGFELSTEPFLPERN